MTENSQFRCGVTWPCDRILLVDTLGARDPSETAMKEEAMAMSTEMIVVSVILVLAIFYFAFRFANRAKKVNKKFREQEQGTSHDDTA